MPLRPEFSGVGKLLQVNNTTVLAKSAGDDTDMSVSAEHLMQGTIENRIFRVENVSKTYTVSAPILVGGGSAIDGRYLLNKNIANVFARKTMVLPILQDARISLSQQGGEIDLTLLSDGNPYNGGVFNIQEPLTPPVQLNPNSSIPTRVAVNYDFRVRVGPFVFFIKDSSIEFKVKSDKKYYIGGISGTPLPTDPSRPGGSNYQDPTQNPYNWNTQFPYLVPSGIELSGSVTCDVLLSDADGTPDQVVNGIAQYFTNASTDPDVDFSTTNVAVNYLPHPTNSQSAPYVTLQCPGYTVTENSGVYFEVYQATSCSSGQWVDLFDDPDNPGTSLFSFDKSMITKYSVKYTPESISASINFQSYIVKN